MSGLPQQTAESVLGTIDYCEELLKRFGKDGRLSPFISPLAPFLDPGSRGFENPEEHGYRLFRAHPGGASPAAGGAQLEVCAKL